MNLREFSKMTFKLKAPAASKAGRPSPPEAPPPVHEPDAGLMVAVTLASVFVSTLVAFRFLTPVLHTLAVFPFFYAAQRRQDPAWAATLVVRWMLALFMGTMIAGAFTPDRVVASVPFGDSTAESVELWLRNSGHAVPAWTGLLWGTVLFLVASVVSGGALGLTMASIALTTTAAGSLYLFRHGSNVIQMAIASVPVWQWCVFAAIPFLLVPTSTVFYQRVFGDERDAGAFEVARIHLYLGAGLLASALLLRLVLAGPWRDLLQRWTLL